MKKQVITFLILFIFTSCANDFNRLNYLKKIFPEKKVEPASDAIRRGGYEFLIIDTTGQMIAVSFTPFSEKRILELRNVR